MHKNNKLEEIKITYECIWKNILTVKNLTVLTKNSTSRIKPKSKGKVKTFSKRQAQEKQDRGRERNADHTNTGVKFRAHIKKTKQSSLQRVGTALVEVSKVSVFITTCQQK